MQYWWVNHKKTHKSEISGGFIWSPQVEKDGRSNNSYNNMTKTEPGDIIFSFAFAEIRAIGIITKNCIEAPRPVGFENASDSWGEKGWLVRVDWKKLGKPFRVKDCIEQLAPELPTQYSPIQKNGSGNQKCYLASISAELSSELFSIANINQNDTLLNENLLEKHDNEIEKRLSQNTHIATTEIKQIVKARKGQGVFRTLVTQVESGCRVTGVKDKRFLIASHIKPWRISSNQERLDGNNGLLLSPHIDKLFDQGWITFQNEGTCIAFDDNIKGILSLWGIPEKMNVGKFNAEQQKYLSYHRNHIFKGGYLATQ